MKVAAPPERQRGEERPLLTYHEVDWKDEKSVVDFVAGRWDTRPRRLGEREKQWYTNIAFFLGQQWLSWNSETRSLESQQAPPWRVRLTINLVQGVARKNVAKILRNHPIWGVVPATGDPDDMGRARLAEKLGRSYWKGQLRMDRRLTTALHWMSVCGTSAIRVFWDPRRGPPMNVSEDEVGDDDEARKILQKRGKKGAATVHQGDAETEVVSPFELDPDPAATTPEDLTHIIHSRLRPLSWVRDHHPDKAAHVEPDAEENRRFYERKIADMAGPSSFSAFLGGTSDTKRDENAVVVHDVWGCEPVKGFPNGIHAVVAGGTVLAVENNEYVYAGEPALPFAFFREIEVPGVFWGTCALEQAEGLQSNLNRARSQLIENRNMMTRPKWLAPKGCGIGEFALTSEPGEVVEHTPGLEPKIVPVPPLPPYVIRELEQTRIDFQDVTNLHEVSNAQAPPNVRSGVAVSALQEQDENILIPTVQAVGYELEKLGSMTLELLSRKVTETRLAKIVGENQSVEFEHFTGKDLRGDKQGVNYFDVHVQMGSQLPSSKEGRQQYVGQLVSLGILNAETDRKKIFQLLELGVDEPLYDVARLDRANARAENRQMLEGVPAEVHPWDDHEIHLEELRSFQKTPEYAKARQTNPGVDLIYEDHAKGHEAPLMPPPEPQVQAAPEDMGAMPPAMPPPMPMPMPMPEIPPAPPPPAPDIDLLPEPQSVQEALLRDIAAARMGAVT